MAHNLISLATEVVNRADREHPADAVLRAKLKEARGISSRESARVSDAVFAYYRWLGWLDKGIPLADQMAYALELNRSFKKNPEQFSPAELERAIPDWAKTQVNVSVEWLRALQQPPMLWLRARPGTGPALAERLGNCQPAGSDWRSDALHYGGAEDLFRTPEFHAGEFELQDLSSQAVGWLCQPQPGETWWDACAGEGGKTLHLCGLMQNKGLLWASDRAAWRLQKLKRRTARAKIFNYRAALWDGSAKLPTKTKFDGILLDAPCSGIGTWQRNPQARWTTAPQDVEELSAVQKNLLSNAVTALKPNGKLIYSVCTLAQAETAGVADEITQRFSELEPILFTNPFNGDKAAQLWLWPQAMQGNGMFICGWRKRPA